MTLIVAIPSILAVYSAITPQSALNATVITQPLIWIERDYCIPFVNIIAAVNVIFSFTFLTVLGSTALAPLLLLSAATDLGHRAVVDSVTHLRLIEAGLLVPAKKSRRLAVNWSRAIPLVPSLRLRRQLWAVCCPVALLHLAIFLYFASLFFWQLLKVRCPVTLLHLADPVPAARANNLGVSATTRWLRQGFRQLNKSTR